MLDKIFESRFIIILVSIIWGLGLSTLFNNACKGRNCYIVHGSDINNVVNSYFNYGTKKCYKYYPFITKCK